MKNIPLMLNHCSELYSLWSGQNAGRPPADRIMKSYFRSRHYLGAGDRRFIGYLFYDMIRNLRLYRWQIRNTRDMKSENIPPALLTVHAYKHRYPEESKTVRFRLEDRISRYFREYSPADIFPDHPAVRWSVPELLWEKLNNSCPPEALNRCLETLLRRPEVHLRVNTLKTRLPDLLREMRDVPVSKGKISPAALRLNKHTDLTRHPLFRRGMFEFQDESSQLVAYACDPQSNDLVVDLCAGGGGKTLHLAALMQNKGTLIATDRDPGRLRDLKPRAKRAGASNIRVTALRDLRHFRDRADILLIDAPCSGSGVYRRNPDAKWELTNEMLDLRISTQKRLLDEYAGLLKKGGRLIYATCSLLPDENAMQIDGFLQRHPGFAPAPLRDAFAKHSVDIPPSPAGHMLTILPQDYDSDGFFIAALRRK